MSTVVREKPVLDPAHELPEVATPDTVSAVAIVSDQDAFDAYANKPNTGDSRQEQRARVIRNASAKVSTANRAPFYADPEALVKSQTEYYREAAVGGVATVHTAELEPTKT